MYFISGSKLSEVSNQLKLIMNYLKSGAICLALFALAIVAQGQEEETLNGKFQNLVESSETFNQYKVITKTNLDAFWSEVMDSLRQDDKAIVDLNTEVASQKVAIDTLTRSKQSISSELEASLNANDSISFLGIAFSKLGYHILVWSIILVLTVLGLIAYLMYMRSNKVTTRSKKDLDSLQVDYDDLKNRSREKEVKLKRELQTALNTLEESRRARA